MRGIRGIVGATGSGEEGRENLRVLFTRAATASSSESPSDEEAEPEIESSRAKRFSTRHTWTRKRTTYRRRVGRNEAR